ncbi:hypothetical protein [Fretibacter rubidus]|uniref:hypothetical protein n=1 Tax=Fretibacter rubidus TaxID=570162 RepID=UPI00352B8F90
MRFIKQTSCGFPSLKRASLKGTAPLALLAVLGLGLSGCQTITKKDTPALAPPASMNETIAQRKLGNNVTRGPRIYRDDSALTDGGPVDSVRLPSQLGTVPSIGTGSMGQGEGRSARAPRSAVKTIEAYVTPLPVPQFINVVYGEMLKVPFVAGKDVAAMTEIISLRSSGTMKASDFQNLVELALEEYGVRVVPEDGTYKIIQDAALRSRIPVFVKSRARARTRSDLRPIVQFVEMQAVSSNAILPLLQDTFGNRSDKLKISSDPQSNFIILSGLPEDVNSALAVLNELDELDFAGTQVQRYTPQYWNAEEFATTLADALRVEGWEVSSDIKFRQTRNIVLFPVKYSNDVFIFAKTDSARARVQSWIRDLDRPVQGGDTEQIFIYQVKNVDAEILAETANSAMRSQLGQGGGAAIIFGGPSGNNNTGNDTGRNTLGSVSGGFGDKFAVDTLGNRIIFTGTASEYDKMVGLLERLDTPTPEVLIEVQIAEVTLTDENSFGVEFFIDDLGNNSVTGTVATQGGIGLGSGGVNVGLLSGNIDAAINAFASNRRVKILSTPIVTARSGAEAELSVGQEVPIITSQRAADNQSGGGDTDILQSIDYRKTGVLLAITPIVFSDNRIDLTISQEVSSTVSVANSTIASPTISNRNILTQLSLEDGQTAVLGGLIQESLTREDTGVPFLKDLPGIGAAFSNESISKDTTELVVLITAYVLRGQADKDQFVNRLSSRVDRALADDSRLYTLRPKEF